MKNRDFSGDVIVQNTTDILAIDGDAIQAIMAVVFMLIAGLSGLLKKKAKPGEDDGKTLIVPPHKADGSAPAAPRPARPAARPAQAPRPQRMATPPAVRPTPIQQQGRQPQAHPPQARPTPVARHRQPQARPTPIQQPTQRQRRPSDRVPPSEPARPGPVPQRPTRRPAAQSERQTHRVLTAEHAKTVATHAEHIASSLKEKQMRKFGQLGMGEHFHEDQSVPAKPRHPLLARLNPQSMRDAILLSEIIQPPLALRNEQSNGWL